jgi:hypothetical protein
MGGMWRKKGEGGGASKRRETARPRSVHALSRAHPQPHSEYSPVSSCNSPLCIPRSPSRPSLNFRHSTPAKASGAARRLFGPFDLPTSNSRVASSPAASVCCKLNARGNKECCAAMYSSDTSCARWRGIMQSESGGSCRRTADMHTTGHILALIRDFRSCVAQYCKNTSYLQLSMHKEAQSPLETSSRTSWLW